MFTATRHGKVCYATPTKLHYIKYEHPITLIYESLDMTILAINKKLYHVTIKENDFDPLSLKEIYPFNNKCKLLYDPKGCIIKDGNEKYFYDGKTLSSNCTKTGNELFVFQKLNGVYWLTLCGKFILQTNDEQYILNMNDKTVYFKEFPEELAASGPYYNKKDSSLINN